MGDGLKRRARGICTRPCQAHPRRFERLQRFHTPHKQNKISTGHTSLFANPLPERYLSTSHHHHPSSPWPAFSPAAHPPSSRPGWAWACYFCCCPTHSGSCPNRAPAALPASCQPPGAWPEAAALRASLVQHHRLPTVGVVVGGAPRPGPVPALVPRRKRPEPRLAHRGSLRATSLLRIWLA